MAVTDSINMKAKILPVTFISLWFCIGIYFGSGGYNYINVKQSKEKALHSNDTIKVTYDGVSYKNKETLVNTLEKEATVNLYPLIEPLPTELWNLITIFAFGMLGSVVNLLKQIAIDNQKVEDLKYISLPLLGMITGFIIIGLAYIVPNTLATTEIELKPMSLMFLSLFSGFFTVKFYEYFSQLFAKIFKN